MAQEVTLKSLNKNVDVFAKEMGQFYNEEVVKRIPKVSKFSAAIVIHKLLKISPVFTGSYMLSHRISRQYFNMTYTLKNPILDPQTKQSIRANKNQIRRIARTQLFKKLRSIQLTSSHSKIQISNSIPYATQVEYGFETGKPGHRVYGLAYTSAEATLNRMLNSISRARWDSMKDTPKITKKMNLFAGWEQALKDQGDPYAERTQMARDAGYEVD